MTRPVAASLVVLALATLAWAWWWSGSAPVPPESGGVVTVDAGAAREGFRAAPPARDVARDAPTLMHDAQPEPAAVAGAPGPAVAQVGVLSGYVLRARDGTPVVDVEVKVRPSVPRAGSSRHAVKLDEVSCLTDADGRYRFEFKSAVQVAWVEVLPGPDTLATGTYVPFVPIGEELTRDLLVSVGSSIAARVVDEHGAPIAGASVSVLDVPASFVPTRYSTRDVAQVVVADESGRFSVHRIGHFVTLEASAPGRATWTRLSGRLGFEERAEGEDLLLTLVPATSLNVHVLDAEGEACASATVELEVLAPPDKVATSVPHLSLVGPPKLAPTGSAKPDCLSNFDAVPRMPLRVRVRSANHLPWEGTHSPEDGDLVVRLERGLGLQLDVQNRRGQSVTNARLRLESRVQHAELGLARVHSMHGEIIAGLVEDHDARLSIWAPGYAVQCISPLAITQHTVSLLVVLDDERFITGTVVDTFGQPVPGALLRITGDRLCAAQGPDAPHRPTWESRFESTSEATANDEGRFHFEGLYDGEFTIEARSPDAFAPVGVARVRAGATGVVVRLDPQIAPGVRLIVDVRGGEDSPRVSTSTLAVFEQVGGGWQPAPANVDSTFWRYVVHGLSAGTYQLRVSAPGYLDWVGPATSYADGVHTVDVTLTPRP